jgi:hypothetical protein
MKIMPVAGSIARVIGSRIIIVLAALNPGIAPTTMPRIVAGIIIHQ